MLTWFDDSRGVRMMVASALGLAALVAGSIAIKKALTRELDVYVILHASRNLIDGIDIYADPAANGAYYLYLPLLAFLFTPLTLLSQTVAGLAWTLACILLIGWSLHETAKLIAGAEYSEVRPFERYALHLLPLICCADAISSEIGNAQVNCLILAAAVLALKLAGSSEAAAGAVLGGAAVAKVFTAPLLLYELLHKRFRIVAAALVGVIVALLTPSLLIGWQKNLDYISYWTTDIALHTDVTSHRSGFAVNASIQAVLTRLLTDQSAFVWNGSDYHLNVASLDPSTVSTVGMLIPLAALLILVTYYVLFRQRQYLTSYWGGIAIAFCIAPLITPVVERPHFVMLLPAYIYVSWMWLHERLTSKLFYSFLVAAFALSTFTLKLYVGEFCGNIFWSLGAPTIADMCLIAAIFVAATHQNEAHLTAKA
jgi:hypothetical protein